MSQFEGRTVATKIKMAENASKARAKENANKAWVRYTPAGGQPGEWRETKKSDLPQLMNASFNATSATSPGASSSSPSFTGESMNPYFQLPGSQRTSNEAYRAAAGGQAAKDQAAFGAMGNLGIAAQNAMGRYGVSRNNALANSNVAAANAYGAMANNYQNTLGQLGYLASNLSAAGLNAGAQSAQGRQNSNVNFNMGGNASFGGGGGGYGFNASGPEGTIASGSYGGGGGFGSSFGGSMGGGGGMNAEITRGASPEERTGMVNQGYGFIDQLRGDLNNPENQAMALAGLMGDEFGANRAALMDPSITNSLNAQLDAGYGALSGLYGMSDYGFNTGSTGYTPSFMPEQGQPAYWMDPVDQRFPSGARPGGRFL
jgi:hypothetical protein